MKQEKTNSVDVIMEGKVNDFAKLHGWQKLEEVNDNNGIQIMKFKRGGAFIYYYLRTKVIRTVMFHNKKKGNSILERRNLFLDQLEEVFKNPRVHTGKGKILSVNKLKQKQ